MIIVNIKPITTNQLFQGRRYKTKKYDDFITEFLYLIPKDTIRVTGIVKLTLNFYIKRDTMTDIDNLLKGTIDCIVKAGLIEDDSDIYKLIVSKYKSNDERIEFKIRPLDFNKHNQTGRKTKPIKI